MKPRNILSLLLGLCPRLTLLSYALEGDTYELLPFDCTPLPAPQVTDLRDLAWPDLVDVLSDPSLLSRCCPHLKCATFGDESGKSRRMTDISALVHHLQRGCKQLEELYFEPEVCYSPETIPLENDRNTAPSLHTRHGLRSIYISAKTWVNPDTFNMLITSNAESLQDIVYRSAVHSDDMPESLNGRQNDLRFPELRILDLGGSIPSVLQPLANFVHHCPVLEDLTLAGIDLETTGLMDALLQARLQRLWLNAYQGSARVALRFMTELANRGVSSTLKDISIAITTPHGQWENVFVMAGGVPRLERFRFILPAPALSKEAIARFVDKARRSGVVSSLKSLKIVTEQDDAPEIIKPSFTLLKELMCVRPR
ncbi:hypothetical protein BCR43DRAFT_505066 [Syncephalastrum racemosum]|uniref:F-box domain-containing protein n=1 Tax=Syncephalastrum racemosum TaxID=13706 RepID=A0A1X2HBG2_SYNRA|nr:hypothetical protein BCR43DRAFT_505066 [Syncephalastrum racemosum]